MDDIRLIASKRKGDFYLVKNNEEKVQLVRVFKRLFENNWPSYAYRIKVGK